MEEKIMNLIYEIIDMVEDDEYLTWNHIDVGSVWEEPDEEKKTLFFKQKHMMDTFLSTGALTKEQYDFSLSGLVVKMGFDFDILKEE